MHPSLGKLGIPGDEDLQNRLLRYLQGGRVHPAAILVGPKGLRRWTLAKNIAKQLLCTDPKNYLFCNQCSFCRRIEKEILPDVLMYQELEEEKVKIDTLRDLCHQMSVTPMEAKGKVCLIDECHRMTSSSANAFLKTLEEPGENCFFWLLTSQPGSLPATLRSRCLTFRLAPESTVSLWSAEEATLFADLFRQTLEAKSTHSLTASLTSKEKVLQFVHFLQTQLRNAVTAQEDNFFPPASEAEKRTQFSKTLELERRLHSNANYSLMLDSFFRQTFI